ncbi:hypothetical protein XANCAGTX0491_006133 [Xanthoria calcicola]
MNLRTPLLNGTFSPHMHSCRRQSPRLLSLSFQPIVAVEARRGLLSTPFPRDQQQSSTFNKDAGSTSTPPSLLKVCNLAAPHTGHIRIITLNSPRNKNALSLQLLAELEAELRGIQSAATQEDLDWHNNRPGAVLGSGTRAIIIGSEVDGVFCAGADLKERKEMTRQQTNDFLRRLRRTFTMIHRSDIPSISAISSIAFGGGLEMGLATHFRVFSSATTVALPETRLGIVPGAGGTYRLGSLLGETRALDLVLTGRRIKGEEASRLGLCDRLVGPPLGEVGDKGIKDDELRQCVLQGAIDMAKAICEGGPATTKPAMNMIRVGQEEVEAKEYDKVLATEDRDEALQAFAEKRKAVFKGK